MTLSRRSVLASGAAAALFSAAPSLGRAAYAPTPGPWRLFEVTTRVTLPRGAAPAQAWVPVPSFADSLWSRPRSARVHGPAATASLESDSDQGIRFVHARWEAGDAPATLEVVSQVGTRDRRVDLSTATPEARLSPEARAKLTAPTDLIPTDGIVLETAERITQGATSDLVKAQRIYDWVVESTERNPETRGCGIGDIASMLHMGDLTGKCADLNALYVGLARASGLPARDLYGLRVAPSAFGYKSLGAGSSDVTKAQHCRAEVFLEGYGWVPVDPADVRKVVLQEQPQPLTLADDKVWDVRDALFGAAEGNWICFNDAHDVTLPGATQGKLPFLMYPQAEIDGVALDPLDPESFAYTITARELEA